MHKKLDHTATFAETLRDLRGALAHMYPTSNVRIVDNETIAITDTAGRDFTLVLYR